VSDPDLTDVWSQLATDTPDITLTRWARHPSTPGELLDRIVVEAYADETRSLPTNSVLDVVVGNPSTEARTLVRCARDVYRQAKVAGHPNLPEGLVAELGDSAVVDVRYHALTNPAAPVDALVAVVVRFADGDRSAYPCVTAVASNPSTPAAILRRVFDAGRHDHLAALAANPSTPSDLLTGTTDCPHGPLGNHPARLATNPACPVTVLERLAHRFPLEVAANPACPPQLLARLSHTSAVIEVARHRSTPPEVLVRLAGSAVGLVRRAIVDQPDHPDGVRGPMLARLPAAGLHAAWYPVDLVRLAGSHGPDTARFVAFHAQRWPGTWGELVAAATAVAA
jgi:hypothetical protein